MRKSKLTVCAVFKDEAPYLEEWLSFHELMGATKFVLYNDDSTDNFMGILEPWIAAGKVTLRSTRTPIFRRARVQSEIYNHCLNRERISSSWLAFLDLDEFLFSPTGLPLPEVLDTYRRFPAVLVRWLLFGSGGHRTASEAGVLESYLWCQGIESAIKDDFDHGKRADHDSYVTGWSRCGKTVVNPLGVWRMGIHLPLGRARTLTVEEDFKTQRWRSAPGTPFSADALRINHYWSKSIEELTAKIERGAVSTRGRHKRNLAMALGREKGLNNVYDTTILKVRDAFISNRKSGV